MEKDLSFYTLPVNSSPESVAYILTQYTQPCNNKSSLFLRKIFSSDIYLFLRTTNLSPRDNNLCNQLNQCLNTLLSPLSLWQISFSNFCLLPYFFIADIFCLVPIATCLLPSEFSNNLHLHYTICTQGIYAQGTCAQGIYNPFV